MPAGEIARVRGGVAVALSMLVLCGALASGARAQEPGPSGSPEKPGRVDAPKLAEGEYDAPPTPTAAPELPGWSAPKPSRARVRLDGNGASKRAGDSPVSLRSKPGRGAERDIEVEVLDQVLADRVGADGFLIRVSDLRAPDSAASAGRSAVSERAQEPALPTSPTQGIAPVDPAGADPVTVTVDYSSIATRFGGGFGARLQLRLLPSCALEVPVPQGCDASGVLLKSINDFTTSTLTADLDPADQVLSAATDPTHGAEPSTTTTTSPSTPAEDLSTTITAAPSTTEAPAMMQASGAAVEESAVTSTTSTTAPEPAEESAPVEEAPLAGGDSSDALAGGSVLAVSSGSSGALGSYAATPLAGSSRWQVGPGSGEFSWSYPVPVQPGPAGDAPDLALGYSSARVDGMVGGENNQAPQEGIGWGLTEAFIERRYVACSREGISGAQDLCWRKDNAILHLNGVTTELVKISSTEWKAKDDPNWKVTTGTGKSNGDNNGEYWRVRTPEGTMYDFGSGTIAEQGGLVTNSALNVQVWGDDAGDPCDTATSPFGLGYCSQAWRWNLDRVEDPTGNVTAYVYAKETNKYRLRYYNSDATYDRASRLARIDYGLRAGQDLTPASRVLLDAQHRCVYLVSACANPAQNAAGYPDVPTDLICSSSCTKPTPTFFSTKRYSAIRSQTYHDGAMHDVDVVTLVHEFQDNGEDQDGDGYLDSAMWLRYIDRHGDGPDGSISMPTIRLGGVLKVNRADANPAGGALELKQWRVDEIHTDTGARINVTYTQPNPCSTIPTTWNNNTKDCFPRYWSPPDSPSGFAAFEKWLVGSVRTTDLVGGSPAMLSSYTYHGTPAWHYDDDPMLTTTESQSWSDWRGYEKTTVTEGDTPDPSRTRTRYHTFRGMHGDRLTSTTTKSVSLTATDGTVTQDTDWRAGRTYEQVSLANDNATVVTAKRYAYTALTTGTSTVDGQLARWAGVSGTRERHQDIGTVYRDKVTATTYNANRLVEHHTERGWDDLATDDRCTRTLYATANTSTWKLDYPKEQTLRDGTGCSTGTLTRHTQWDYDGLAHGAAPTRGTVTKQRAATAAGAWSETATAYDGLGRVQSSTDANGNTTQTSYSPAYVSGTNASNPHPTSVTTTVLKSPLPVDAADHVSTVTLDPERIGSPRTVTDPNGNVTTVAYDALGRTDKVWLATEATTETPSVEYDYELVEHSIGYGLAGPPKTSTVTLQDEAGASDELIYSYEIYDGLARQRQQASFSPTGTGSTLTQTRYDTRGLLAARTMPQGAGVWPNQLASLGAPANDTVYDYDALGRTTSETFRVAGTTRWTTTSANSYNATTITPPVGGQKRTTVDAHGRAISVAEHDGTTWRSSDYTHNPAGDLTSITDAAGNKITYGYDLAGRRTAMADPDAGAWTYAYDLAGNRTTVTDADSTTPNLVTIYDALNRPTQRREGSMSGTLLAEWQYDAAGEKGLLDKTVRHDPTLGAITVDIAGYDLRQRPTGRTWIIPGTAGNLAGSYPITYGYDEADHQTAATYPAAAGLAAETVTTAYANTTGLPLTLTGSDPYVSETVFDDRRRVDTRTLGAAGSTSVTRDYAYSTDQRLTDWKATTGAGQVIQDDRISHDAVGNVTQRRDARAGVDQLECYAYDQRSRLTRAFTNGSGTCTAPDQVGPAPYDHTYTYAVDGKITSRNEGTGTKTYSYPAQGTGAIKPHAVTAVGSDTYGYDANGNMTSRPGDSGQQAMVWNSEHQLAFVTEGTTATNFVYDADGQRLLRRAPDGRTTLYIEGHEYTDTGAAVTSKRYYTLAGTQVAVRDSAGGGSLHYLLGDQLGSTTAAVNASTGATSIQRYLPYGALRSGAITATERGWIGQTKDASTGLQYLNARYYDPTIGRFTAIDTVIDSAQPASLDRYGYGHDNPITLSDPTGLWIPIGNGGAAKSGQVINNRVTAMPAPVVQGPRLVPAAGPRRTASTPYAVEFTLANGNFIAETGGSLQPESFTFAPSRPAQRFRDFWFFLLFALEEEGWEQDGVITQTWIDEDNDYLWQARQAVTARLADSSIVSDPASGGALNSLGRAAPKIAQYSDEFDAVVGFVTLGAHESSTYRDRGPLVVRGMPLESQAQAPAFHAPRPLPDLFLWPSDRVVQAKAPG